MKVIIYTNNGQNVAFSASKAQIGDGPSSINFCLDKNIIESTSVKLKSNGVISRVYQSEKLKEALLTIDLRSVANYCLS